ncbi:NitT/TauT family transport system substrate-binding protein [Thalassospira xiamenensis M-5 = DSM 17429]|uniref:Sulfonate/nitrate transport system substrate-binding protein n=1 Tax=Thalassospira xiamenensis M-5 = DSM 17429 TaxID=1123366 RepID=A0AB72UBV1_9PROT|nr:ABC transporter substrate-binding protein [Thalassospira xiamenensis]AJD51609.1 putative sulfonate/nitrate transport system substrate-binding protein [Thalassospira xiamenensis M-5 = DSM 17429]SIT31663.1 NitT/TauT family transport system substrate-binding protein [Thalassospira xiamenensis M-5 = DSM 17429]
MKHLFKGLCLSAIALGTVWGLSAPASANQELTIAHSTWVGYGPLYIARDKGFFEEEGLDVDLVVMEDVKTRMPALAAGRIDVAVTTIDTVLAFYSPEHPLSYLFALDDSRGGDGIVAGKDIKTIADLKGKSIAFTEGSVSQFFLSVLLKDAGMKLSDVNALNMSAGDAGAAFVAQKVDAAVTWEPWLTRGKDTDHGHVLVDSTKTPGLITDIMVTTNDMLEKNRPAMEGLYRAWSKAIAWQKDNVEEADEIMAKGVGGWLEDPAVFAETRAGIVFYDDAMNKTFMDPANEGGILGTIKNAKALGEEGGLFTIDADPASLIAADIVK